MASIRSYRDGEGRAPLRGPLPRRTAARALARRSPLHKDAQAFKLDVERRRQAGLLYQAPPERFGDVAQAWLERYVIGAAGRVRPRPRSIARRARTASRYLAPLNDLAVERIRRPLVEDLIAAHRGARAAPGRDGARAAQAHPAWR